LEILENFLIKEKNEEKVDLLKSLQFVSIAKREEELFVFRA
jgi:hypothetical protein